MGNFAENLNLGKRVLPPANPIEYPPKNLHPGKGIKKYTVFLKMDTCEIVGIILLSLVTFL